MKAQINPSSFALWLSANDTFRWARKPGASWPCSELSGNRLFVSFDKGGLTDFALNGKSGVDVSGDELTACVSDHVRARLPVDHPCACYLSV